MCCETKMTANVNDSFTTLVDKHAHILVKSLPNFQELVHISFHKVFLYRLALSSKGISC